jgi:glucokinase
MSAQTDSTDGVGHLPQAERSRLAIGIDVGGTKVSGGVVTADGELLDRTRLPTPTSDDEHELVAAIDKVVEALLASHPSVEAIGAGCAGLVEWPSGCIRFASNNVYRNLPLRRHLVKKANLPTVVDNDANVAVWAEANFGAAIGMKHVAMLTVGTGIGGGLYLHGDIYRGSAGLAGEVGHLIVSPEGDPCACGNRGCLEALASGAALGRGGRSSARANPTGRLATLAGGPDLVTGETVYQAARRGDEIALALFDRLGFWLGLGMASIVTLLDLDALVIGGGLVETGDLLLVPARASLERHVYGRGHRVLPALLPAKLGSDAGIVGAATLALRQRP